MRMTRVISILVPCCVCAAVAWRLVVAQDAKDDASNANQPAPAEKPAEPAETARPKPKRELPRVSLEVARDRAKLMHEIYLATLASTHQRYFHGDRAVVPARAMEDVFREIEYSRHIQSRWISASFSPMSIDHEPKSEFEKRASRKLASGEEAVETIEDGYYRRAGSVNLGSGCIRCHSLDPVSMSTRPKYAGLVISVPVVEGTTLEP